MASLTAELLDEGTKRYDALQLDAEKKRLGLEVTSEKVEERGRVYKLPAA